MTALEALTIGRQHGITPAAMHTLHTLLAVLSDPPMLPSKIAKLTGTSTAAITGSMDRLQELGMIERLGTQLDRRSRPATPSVKAFGIFQPALEEVAVAS